MYCFIIVSTLYSQNRCLVIMFETILWSMITVTLPISVIIFIFSSSSVCAFFYKLFLKVPTGKQSEGVECGPYYFTGLPKNVCTKCIISLQKWRVATSGDATNNFIVFKKHNKLYLLICNTVHCSVNQNESRYVAENICGPSLVAEQIQ